MELDGPDYVLPKREKKSKKKKTGDNELANIEAKGTAVDDTGIETNEDDNKKKKREKKEKRNKDNRSDSGLMHVEVKGMALEDDGVETKEDYEKSRKKEKGEKGNKENYLQDINVSGEELTGERNKIRKKHEKHSKLESKQLVNNHESNLEFNYTKEDKKRKKENRKNVEKEEGTFDGVPTAPSRESHVGIEMNNESLSLSRDKKESNFEIDLEVKKDKRKQKKERYRHKGSTTTSLQDIQNCKEVRENTEAEEKDISADADVEEEGTIDVEQKETKKKKKKEKLGGVFDSLSVNISSEPSTKDKKSQNIASVEERNPEVHAEGSGSIYLGNSKKRKKDKKNKNSSGDCSREVLEMRFDVKNMPVGDIGDGFNEVHPGPVDKKKRKRDMEKGAPNMKSEKIDKDKRKKAKSIIDVKEKNFDQGKRGTKSKGECADGSRNLKPERPSKRVKFSDKVEIFPSSDGREVGKKKQEGLVRGKRFSQEEDKIIEDAVLNYIKEHNLGEDGLKQVMRCQNNPETRNCWKEISTCMPWRPLTAIYNRAHCLFERDSKRAWTPEEIELVKKFHAEHGPKWRSLADELGKSRYHVKDTWRRICLPNMKQGHWTQEEYQKLFDLVNMDLRMKVNEEKKDKHGMLRDNIAWEAISQKLSTRTNMTCCKKWYTQLESPLVREGKWASSDDFRLVDELVARDYSSKEEVDWDDLLDHRPGDICRKRWLQMVNHLGEHGNKAFADQVEVLRKRYCPDVLEARVEYEKKVPVDVYDADDN